MRNSNKSPGCLSSLIGMALLLLIIDALSSIVRFASIIIVIAIVIFLIYKLITFISMKISERKNSIEYEYYSEEFEDDYGDSEYDLEYSEDQSDNSSDISTSEECNADLEFFENPLNISSDIYTSEEYGAKNHGYLSVNDLQERYHISYDRANEIMNFIEQLNLVSKEDSNNLKVLLCDINVIWYYIEGSFEDCMITSDSEADIACPMPVETTTQNDSSSKKENFVNVPQNEVDNFSEIEMPEKSDVESQISPETTTQNRKTYNFKNCTRYIDIETFARACNTLLHKEDMQEWYGAPNTSNQSDDIPLSQPVILEEVNNTEVHYDAMSGHDFEYFCADLLRKNGFSNVIVTQGSGDHGVDILAEKDTITYAIQCKCYASNIGNAAVQQAHTGKSFYHKDVAVVITNRYFTQQAIEEANVLGVKLWNRNKLDELIQYSDE